MPDWTLVAQLAELIRPFSTGFELASFEITLKDDRGEYFGEDLDELQEKAARRGPPESIEVSVTAVEPQGLRNIGVIIDKRPSAFFKSNDEALVDHLAARIPPLFAQAAGRRQERERSEAAAREEREAAQRAATNLEQRVTVPEPRASPVAEPLHGLKKLVRDPNPWVLIIGGTVVAAVIAAIIIASLHL